MVYRTEMRPAPVPLCGGLGFYGGGNPVAVLQVLPAEQRSKTRMTDFLDLGEKAMNLVSLRPDNLTITILLLLYLLLYYFLEPSVSINS